MTVRYHTRRLSRLAAQHNTRLRCRLTDEFYIWVRRRRDNRRVEPRVRMPARRLTLQCNSGCCTRESSCRAKVVAYNSSWLWRCRRLVPREGSWSAGQGRWRGRGEVGERRRSTWRLASVHSISEVENKELKSEVEQSSPTNESGRRDKKTLV